MTVNFDHVLASVTVRCAEADQQHLVNCLAAFRIDEVTVNNPLRLEVNHLRIPLWLEQGRGDRQ